MASNTSTTMGAIGGGATDGSIVARSSSCPPNVGNTIAVDSTTGEGLSRPQSPERFIPETWVPINDSHQHDDSALDALDHHVPEYDDFGLAVDPGHDAPEEFVHVGYIVNGQIVDPYESAFYIGPGEAHDHGNPETYLAIGDQGGHSTLSVLDSRLGFTALGKLNRLSPHQIAIEMSGLTILQRLSPETSFPTSELLRPWSRSQLPPRCTSSCCSPPRSA